MGSDLRNDVRYVNIDAHPGWRLHDYHREAIANGSGPATWPYPRPGWDRSHPDYAAWLANLRTAGIRLLVVTRADPANGPHNVADASGFPIERQWADQHPEAFEPLYGPAERDPRFRLYRVRERAGLTEAWKNPGRVGRAQPTELFGDNELRPLTTRRGRGRRRPDFPEFRTECHATSH